MEEETTMQIQSVISLLDEIGKIKSSFDFINSSIDKRRILNEKQKHFYLDSMKNKVNLLIYSTRNKLINREVNRWRDDE